MRGTVVASRVAFALLGLLAPTANTQGNNRVTLWSPMPVLENALEVKAGTGFTSGFGRVSPTRTLPDTTGAGFGVALDVDYRMSAVWSVGIEGEYQQLSAARGLVGNLGVTYHFWPE